MFFCPRRWSGTCIRPPTRIGAGKIVPDPEPIGRGEEEFRAKQTNSRKDSRPWPHGPSLFFDGGRRRGRRRGFFLDLFDFFQAGLGFDRQLDFGIVGDEFGEKRNGFGRLIPKGNRNRRSRNRLCPCPRTTDNSSGSRSDGRSPPGTPGSGNNGNRSHRGARRYVPRIP